MHAHFAAGISPEATAVLNQDDSRAIARGADRGAHAGESASRDQNIALPGAGPKDNSKQYSLGLAWEALRNVTVGCQYTRLDRDTTNVLYSYNAYTAGCYVQGMIR